MGQELGRISGVMLKANLERHGIDLSVDDDLLYLDVSNNSIGINTTATNNQTSLNVGSSIQTTNLIVDTALVMPGATIKTNTNTIAATVDNLYLAAGSSIISPNIRTDDLNINDNIISSTSSNQPIEFRPHGTGSVEILSDLNVTGNLFATGDININGTIVFGDNNVQDQVDILASITSDILPAQTELYSLGENPAGSGNRWLDVHTNLLNGQSISALSVASNGINLVLRQGNIWYVSKNGSDSNYGNHEASTFLTIEYALSQAEPGDEIVIYPGTYSEITPLTVPVGVSLKGTSIRSVTIVPDASTLDQDVLLVNGETTISDITIKDFFYDSINDTGYAFRFAPGIKVTTRSPYIQNCSVITHGSVSTVSDPRGFDSGDAGRGAKIDGAVADTSTNEAAMLFNNVTLLTPGVTSVVMTNGVRVEWLNCFTYFANIGLYAVAGSGRYDSVNLETRYGAEIRSIGSANVYGNYGAWAEGTDTLMYLVNHNFAYIGAGKDVTNDPSLNNDESETIELDTGKIYYQSVDNKGNFHVGDAFQVSYDTGRVSFNGVSVTIAGISDINFTAEDTNTRVNSNLVSTTNIKFSGNTLSSSFGDVNVVSQTGNTNLTLDVFAEKDLAVTGNVRLDGVLTLGNVPFDIVEFNAPTNSDIIPSSNALYSLGANSGFNIKHWNTINNQLSVVDNDIEIFDNVIQTSQSNSNLELRANAVTPEVFSIATSDYEIDAVWQPVGGASFFFIGANNQLVSSRLIAAVGALRINDTIDITDTSTGDHYTLTVQLPVTFNPTQGYSIRIVELPVSSINTASFTMPTNTATVRFANNVIVDNTLTVSGISTVKNINVSGSINHLGDIIQTGTRTVSNRIDLIGNISATDQAAFETITVSASSIATTASNADLELDASGTGRIVLPTSSATIQNNLTVNGTVIAGSMDVVGDITTSDFTNNDILIFDNIITTTALNRNLLLQANASGDILAGNRVEITNSLEVNALTTLSDIVITGDITHTGSTYTTGNTELTGNYNLSQNLTVSEAAYFNNINIVTNQITTASSNTDLELRAASTGKIVINDNITITNNLNVIGVTTTNGIINSGIISADIFTNGDIVITDNTISTTTSNNNLTLAPNLSGLISVANNDVLIDNDLRVDGASSLTNTLIGNVLTTQGAQNVSGTSGPTGFFFYGWQGSPGSPNPTFNVVQPGWTVVGQPTWVVTAVGDGTTDYNITITGGLFASGGTYAFTGLDAKLLTHTGSRNQTGNVTQYGNYDLTNNLTVTGTATLANIDIINNAIATSDSNSDLELRAVGGGQLVINDVFRVGQSLEISGLLTTAGVGNTGTVSSDIFSNGSTIIKDNYVTTLGNVDLVLGATKNIYLPSDSLLIDNDLTVNGLSLIKNTNINGAVLLTGNKIQTGSVTQTGKLDISNSLIVTGTSAFFDEISIVGNQVSTTSTNSDLELRAAGSGLVYISNDDVAISNSLRINGITTTTTINNSQTVFSDIFTNNTVIISQNYITTQPGINLQLAAAGLGNITLPRFTFNNNSINATTINDTINLTVSSGGIDVPTTNALRIPVGTTANRTTNIAGEIRLNTTDTLFTGWNGARVTFGGLFSTDRKTTVLAHPTNNTLDFTVNTAQVMTLTSSGLTTSTVSVNNDLVFAGNTVSASAVNSSITLTPNNAGKLVLGNITFSANDIQNVDTESSITLENTGFGYVAFGGTGGIALPAGDELSRPTNPELGDFRFNTGLSTAEIFNGIEYVTLGGNSGALLNANEIQEITNLWALVLG